MSNIARVSKPRAFGEKMESFIRFFFGMCLLVLTAFACALNVPRVIDNAFEFLRMAEANGFDTPGGKILLVYSIISFVSCILFPLMAIFTVRAVLSSNKKSPKQ